MEMFSEHPTVVVTVVTDHHPFARLIGWMDVWARQNPAARCIIQHGMSRPPDHAEALDFLGRTDLMALLGKADVVVCQAGPGSILDARRAGIVPVVVPRLARLGEVVDDHQVAFADVMSARGEAIVASSEESLNSHLVGILADPSCVKKPPAPSPAVATGRAVEHALETAVAGPAGVVKVGRVSHVVSLARRLK